eukprot:g3969.t1
MAAWAEGLVSAQTALKEGKLFDGVQAINACMEAFAKALGDETDQVLRDPMAFLEAHVAKLSGEQKDALRTMYEVRGDIITGLGANKRAALDYKNEFGEVGIDDSLIEGSSMAMEENIIEMNNGCICCTVRGDLIAGLKKLIKNSMKSGKALDGVIIETTGLADPAPVAQTFFADDFVQQNLYLDGIVTLVDAKHLILHLDEEKPEGVENEAVEQVAFADRIILNKCDLVDAAQLDEVEKRVRMINEPVKIVRTTQSKVDMDFILGIEAFNLDKILDT